MTTDKLHELQLHALRQIQELAKADGFKRLPDEQAFMDELSGEGPEIIIRNRFTMLTDAELVRACEWWAGLSDGEKMRRRERAVEVRAPFGIELPEDDDDERWPVGEGWAAVCYDDETAIPLASCPRKRQHKQSSKTGGAKTRKTPSD